MPYCKYHVLEPALWRCTPCVVEFCEMCSPDVPGNDAASVHYCPLCNAELKALSAGLSAAPFWLRLGHFLRYPFSVVAFGLMLLAFVLPLLVPDGMAVHGARLAFLLLVMKYSWTAQEQVVTGDLVPIGLSHLRRAENNELALQLGLLLAVMAAAVAYLFLHWPFYALLLAVICLVLLPAVLITTALNRNVGSALSVDGLKATVIGIGPVYVALVLLALALFAALQSFVGLFADVLPLAFGRALAMVAYSYFVMVLVVACAYVLFQFQEHLGFTQASGVARSRKSLKRIDPVQIQVEMFLKEGNYVRATGILRNEAQKKAATLHIHERYHKLIGAMADAEALRQHATPYFKVLLEAGRDAQCAALMRDYNQRFTGFHPDDPDVCLALAEAFERVGDYKLAVHVLNGLHKESPHYPRLPEAYLLAARLLAEHLSLPQKGVALVQYLEGRFRTHPSYPEIKRALAQLQAKPA